MPRRRQIVIQHMTIRRHHKAQHPPILIRPVQHRPQNKPLLRTVLRKPHRHPLTRRLPGRPIRQLRRIHPRTPHLHRMHPNMHTKVDINHIRISINNPDQTRRIFVHADPHTSTHQQTPSATVPPQPEPVAPTRLTEAAPTHPGPPPPHTSGKSSAARTAASFASSNFRRHTVFSGPSGTMLNTTSAHTAKCRDTCCNFCGRW